MTAFRVRRDCVRCVITVTAAQADRRIPRIAPGLTLKLAADHSCGARLRPGRPGQRTGRLRPVPGLTSWQSSRGLVLSGAEGPDPARYGPGRAREGPGMPGSSGCILGPDLRQDWKLLKVIKPRRSCHALSRRTSDIRVIISAYLFRKIER